MTASKRPLREFLTPGENKQIDQALEARKRRKAKHNIPDASYAVYRLMDIGADESNDDEMYFEEPTEDNDYTIRFEHRGAKYLIRLEET